MTATTERRTYHNGRSFYLVTCRACLAVLNSGHHYQQHEQHHAQELADQHNAAHHAPQEATAR